MFYYSFGLCSVEKSKVGNNLIISPSISMGENTFGGVHSLEKHNFSLLIIYWLYNIFIIQSYLQLKLH